MKRSTLAWLLLAPALLVLAGVAGWPLLRSLWFSLTDASISDAGAVNFVGLSNYLSYDGEWNGLLADPDWWRSVRNTFLFAAVSVTLETALGLGFALILNAHFRGRWLVRAIILMPWAVPTIVSARIWGWMLNDQFGIVNDLLLKLHIIDTKIAWTATPDTAMYAVLAVDIWKTTPFMALLILAGLQMIPKDIYEAAAIDGVHPVKVFFRVTLPLVRPALMVAVIFRLLDALRIFDLIYVLTPNSAATKTMSVISRENLIDFDKFAYGSAESTLLFIIIGVLTVLYIWLGRVNLEGDAR
jgi:trehalose/maltose transport system permease protein